MLPSNIVATSAPILAPYLADPDFSDLLWDGDFPAPVEWLVLTPDLVKLCWDDMSTPSAKKPTLVELGKTLEEAGIPHIFARVQNPHTRPTIDSFMIPTEDEDVITAIEECASFEPSSLTEDWTTFNAA